MAGYRRATPVTLLSRASGSDHHLIIPGLALQESQDFKVPQLRGFIRSRITKRPGRAAFRFGFIHDGTIDSLLSFLRLPVFTFRNDNDRRDVEAFVLAFDSGLARPLAYKSRSMPTISYPGSRRERIRPLSPGRTAETAILR
jgi:hypothetical protein